MARNNKKSSDDKIVIIESQGGDIAYDHSVIDKRTGNIQDKTNKDSAKHSVYLKVVLGIVVSTFLGIVANIVANYLQERFNLIETPGRVLIVLIVFIISLVFNIILGIKSMK